MFFSVTCLRLGQNEKNEKVYVKFSYVLNPYILLSFAVTQLPGKHTAPGMQVLVQGNQVAIVAKFLLGKFLASRSPYLMDWMCVGCYLTLALDFFSSVLKM